MKAVILAGGFGKRLKPLTDEKPKPMIDVLDKPIIEWQIRWLRNHGISDVILCVGYMKENIVDYIGSGTRLGVNAYYTVEDTPLGTGGALKNAESLLASEDKFFMLNGDVLTNLDPNRLECELSNGLVATIAVVPLPSPFGVLQLDKDSRVLGFTEKPKITQFWINAGVYCLSGKIFSYLPKSGNIETTALPALAKSRKLKAVKFENSFWRSIDSHKDIEEASREIGAIFKRAVPRK
ncbi:MAG: nucleotidyltransferase family protein [Nitrososphaerales archaeon]